MKVILTNKRAFTSSKDSKSYVVYNGISASGKNVEIFLNKDEADRYNIPDSKVLPADDLQELFNELATVEVDYNDKGRVESVRA